MSWRTVVVENRCKLDYSMGYLVCRGEQTKKVLLDEISTLIVENTAFAVTGVLLAELVKRKINVIFCDERYNPLAQLNAIYGRYDCSGTIGEQIRWSDDIKSEVWTRIVRQKIAQQAWFLKDIENPRYSLLESYAHDVEIGDRTNREGHAAKVYFNALFGMDFKRGDGNISVNGLLDYGYAVLLSAFNREVVSDGYLTQCGIFHRNEFNYYNLSCDLMEPFRVIVDRYVFLNCGDEISVEVKHGIANILNSRVQICDKSVTVSDAISVYCKRVFRALNERDADLVVSYEL